MLSKNKTQECTTVCRFWLHNKWVYAHITSLMTAYRNRLLMLHNKNEKKLKNYHENPTHTSTTNARKSLMQKFINIWIHTALVDAAILSQWNLNGNITIWLITIAKCNGVLKKKVLRGICVWNESKQLLKILSLLFMVFCQRSDIIYIHCLNISRRKRSMKEEVHSLNIVQHFNMKYKLRIVSDLWTYFEFILFFCIIW